MKNKIFITTVLPLLVNSIIFTACEERDSVETKTARVVNNWKYQQVTKNGVDITANASNYTIEFKKDGTYTETGGGSATAGKWEFTDGGNDILLTENGSNTPFLLNIITLKENKFRYKNIIGTDITEFHLEPANNENTKNVFHF